MERRIELLAGLSASVLGLIGVVVEAQALANPLTNPTLSWLLGQQLVTGMAGAIVNAQRALLPLTLVLVALGLGTYLHAVHDRAVGLALLVSCSVVIIAVAAFAVFNTRYVQLLFVPGPLVVFVAFLAAATSVSALSAAGLSVSLARARLRPGSNPRRAHPPY